MRRLLPTFRRHFFSPQTSPDLVERYMSQMQEESFHVLTDQTKLSPPRLANPHTPIMIVRGEYDSIPLRQHQAMSKRYGAALKALPLGHELMLEPQWRSAADCIAGWLTQQGL
jgi:hypothetical protein